MSKETLSKPGLNMLEVALRIEMYVFFAVFEKAFVVRELYFAAIDTKTCNVDNRRQQFLLNFLLNSFYESFDTSGIFL